MHLPAHLPGPLRAAVGLVATAADEAKHLPDRAIELPMLAVSTALQLSLRAQQRYAQLTVRGDEALSRGTTGDEPPPWATFDDDPADAAHPVPGAGAGAGESSVTTVGDEPVSAPISGSGPVPADADLRPPPAPPATAPPSVPAAEKTPSAPRKAPTRKTPARKAAKKAAPRTPSSGSSSAPSASSTQADGKGVSAPRHTPPSRFDTVGDE